MKIEIKEIIDKIMDMKNENPSGIYRHVNAHELVCWLQEKNQEFFQEPLTEREKNRVLQGRCPFHLESELEQKGPYVWCPLSEDEGDDACKFSTTREWIKYQTGKDPWHFELKIPKPRK